MADDKTPNYIERINKGDPVNTPKIREGINYLLGNGGRRRRVIDTRTGEGGGGGGAVVSGFEIATEAGIRSLVLTLSNGVEFKIPLEVKYFTQTITPRTAENGVGTFQYQNYPCLGFPISSSPQASVPSQTYFDMDSKTTGDEVTVQNQTIEKRPVSVQLPRAWNRGTGTGVTLVQGCLFDW